MLPCETDILIVNILVTVVAGLQDPFSDPEEGGNKHALRFVVRRQVEPFPLTFTQDRHPGSAEVVR